MSYCRKSDGDVYMFPSIVGPIICCGCLLAELVPTIFTEECGYCNGEGCSKCMIHSNSLFYTREEALEHLFVHRKAKHKVPRYAIRGLKKEIRLEKRLRCVEENT